MRCRSSQLVEELEQEPLARDALGGSDLAKGFVGDVLVEVCLLGSQHDDPGTVDLGREIGEAGRSCAGGA